MDARLCGKRFVGGLLVSNEEARPTPPFCRFANAIHATSCSIAATARLIGTTNRISSAVAKHALAGDMLVNHVATSARLIIVVDSPSPLLTFQ
jgi:hypothetical protein